MFLSDARENYYTFSATLSSVNRQLCFAGIAIVWVFSTEEANGAKSLPSELLLSLGFFVIGLSFDLLHYIIALATWGIYHRICERNGIGEETEITPPNYINWIPLGCFWLKSVATLAGYISFILVFIH